MYVLIDNYDSFTYNLYQQFLAEDCDVTVVKNDEIDSQKILAEDYQAIIISPGPGNPESAGNCLDIVKSCYQTLPILGVCLGHQIIAQAFGATIRHANEIVHGKADFIIHDDQSLFVGAASPFRAARYHSLCVDEMNLPSDLIISARNESGLLMAIQHRQYPVYGLQFHPESILTEQGDILIKNFIQFVEQYDADQSSSKNYAA